jgi:hypothetical protein
MPPHYGCLGVSATLSPTLINNLLSQVEVTLRPTVNRPVRLGALPFLEQVTRCHIYLSDNYFFYFPCRAPSLTRGRVCNLQCNDASSISSYIATVGLSARSSWSSQSHITTDNQSASPSWCLAPIWDPRPIFRSPWVFSFRQLRFGML